MPVLEQVLAGKQIEAVVLDVRGTIIHPSLDEPLSRVSCNLIGRLLESEVIVALNTATSINSLKVLVIGPLLSVRFNSGNRLDRFVMYVDSSSQAYKLDRDGNVLPLDNFPFYSFDEAELDSVLECIEASKVRFRRINATHKIKPGQVNFYCGGAWEDRLTMARFMNQTFRAKGHQRVTAMVPSAKETIDVAVCQKARGMADLMQRHQLNKAEILIIGDSFQEGGSDLDMLADAPDAVAVQVGEHQPAAAVHHVTLQMGPEATQNILSEVIASMGS
jgi:hypothetical protein